MASNPPPHPPPNAKHNLQHPFHAWWTGSTLVIKLGTHSCEVSILNTALQSTVMYVRGGRGQLDAYACEHLWINMDENTVNKNRVHSPTYRATHWNTIKQEADCLTRQDRNIGNERLVWYHSKEAQSYQKCEGLKDFGCSCLPSVSLI